LFVLGGVKAMMSLSASPLLANVHGGLGFHARLLQEAEIPEPVNEADQVVMVVPTVSPFTNP
jgi:hypothetical protein